MQYSTSGALKQKPSREFYFEIGDNVCLRANPRWLGVVVAKSLAEKNVSVLWDNHGTEQIDSRLLIPATKAT